MTVIISGSGGITSVNGTAAAPSVTGTDTDTGIVYGTNTLSLATGGTTAMTINGSQRVGINNATPQGVLDVGGVNIGSAGDLLVDSTSTAAVVTVGRISSTGSDNTNFRVRNRVDQQAFFVNAGNRTAQVGTTFGVGDTIPATSGAGITFPASQSASTDVNTLDDYEEGTFTPSVEGTSTAGSASYSQRNGRYTKIGRLVSFQLYINWSGGTGTGSLNISGLPFTEAGGAVYPSVTIGQAENIATTALNQMCANVIDGTSKVGIYQFPIGGGAVAGVPYDAAGYLIIGGQYTV